jgi:single stranded DNA-binding protein
MTMDYQKISAVLIGNATQDAEIKQARESGNQYGDFRLAVRNRQGETTYFPVRCFGKLAEGLGAIQKGTKVFVEGELEITAYTGEDGEKRMTFRVLANTYRILGNGRATVASEAGEE